MAFQDLVSSNLGIYDSIKPTNQGSSYTVLATLNDFKSGRLLAAATGTQANLGDNPNDIKDCHAESLLKRAFKRYLVDKISKIVEKCDQTYNSNQLILEECQSDLSLMISQFPCGLVRRYEGSEPVDPETGEPISRKPGRGQVLEGKTVYVDKDSCLVKLQRWTQEGFQGRRLARLFKIHCSIKRILIGDCEVEEDFDYNSHLCRLKELLSFGAHDLEIIAVQGLRRDDLLFSPTKQPQPVALVWWANSDEISSDGTSLLNHSKRFKNSKTDSGFCELIVDGRRRGITKKQISLGSAGQHLKVSDVSLRQDITSASAKLSSNDDKTS